MKELTLGGTVYVDGCLAVVRGINDYSTTLVLDEGTYFEYAYECPTNNIQIDDNGDWYANTDRALLSNVTTSPITNALSVLAYQSPLSSI